MPQRHFFATPGDLQSVFERAAAKGPFRFTLTGLFDSPVVQIFTSASLLPSLGQPAEAQTMACPSYLITPVGVEVRVRPVPQSVGGIKYAVDQLQNADSVTLTHGGLFTTGVFISGRVATASHTPTAKRLQSAISNAIGKLFVKVNALYVGPDAYKLLQQGCRLTFNANSPSEFDLERPSVIA